MSRPFDAVVTDLDGTIVRSTGDLSAATVAAVAALRRAGVPVVAATARTPASLHVAAPVLADLAGAVCSNGAVGLAPSTGRVWWRIPIAPVAVQLVGAALVELLPDAGFGAHDGHAWVVTANYESARGWLPHGPVVVTSPSTVARTEAFAMTICHPTLGAAQVLSVLLTAGIDPAVATMTYGSRHLLDIAPAAVDKGTGVLRALASLGVDPARAVAFGDSHNDLPMFAVVGTSVALANAGPAIQAAATRITTHVDDDGFAQALADLGALSATAHPG